MWGADDEVFAIVYYLTLFLGICPPEDKNEVFFFLRESFYHDIGELLPAHFLMRTWCASTNGESGVEEKNALLSPVLQISCGVVGGIAGVGLDFFVDIAKGGWDFDPFVDGEAEAFGLTLAVVWVLADDHDTHIVEWSEVKSTKDVFGWGVDSVGLILPFYEVCEFFEIISIKL